MRPRLIRELLAVASLPIVACASSPPPKDAPPIAVPVSSAGSSPLEVAASSQPAPPPPPRSSKRGRDGWVVDDHTGGHREPQPRAVEVLATYSNMDRRIVRIASYTPTGKAVFTVEGGTFAGRHAHFQIATDPAELAVGQRFVAALDFSPSLGRDGRVYVLVPIDSDEEAASVFAAIQSSRRP